MIPDMGCSRRLSRLGNRTCRKRACIAYCLDHVREDAVLILPCFEPTQSPHDICSTCFGVCSTAAKFAFDALLKSRACARCGVVGVDTDNTVFGGSGVLRSAL